MVSSLQIQTFTNLSSQIPICFTRFSTSSPFFFFNSQSLHFISRIPSLARKNRKQNSNSFFLSNSMTTKVESHSKDDVYLSHSEEMHGVMINHKYLYSKGMKIHFVDCGSPSDHPVVLLHGFPCFWRMWHKQIPFLAKNHFYVIVPDLRGYGGSDKPNQIKDYSKKEVLKDLNALIDACTQTKRVGLVGHDWGGLIAWHFADAEKEKISNLVIINSPHPLSFMHALTNLWHPLQIFKSYYILLFQIPLLPEILFQSFDYGLLRYILKTNPVNRLSDDEIQTYVNVFSPPSSSLHGFLSLLSSSSYPISFAFNYYRAAARGYWSRDMKSSSVLCPVLVLWGEKDTYLIPEVANPPPNHVKTFSVQRFPQSSHWLMWDEPDKVNSSLLQFLKIKIS